MAGTMYLASAVTINSTNIETGSTGVIKARVFTSVGVIRFKGSRVQRFKGCSKLFKGSMLFKTTMSG